MASQVQICNLALQRVGGQLITEIDEGTQAAILCATAYALVVDEVISSGAWSAATFRAVLAQTTATPAFGYDYQYQLPTDPKLLRIIEVYSTSRAAAVDYKIEGTKLLSDDTAVSIRYIGRIDSPDDFGPFITRCVVARLAVELAYTSSATLGLADRLRQEYQATLEECLSLDATQGSADALDIPGYGDNR